MSELTRTLTFSTSDLGKDATLILTFDNIQNPDVNKTVCLIVWKIAKFGKSGQYAFQVRYRSEFGFTSAHISPGNVVFASANTRVNVGEKTILEETGTPSVYDFSRPTPIQPSTDQMVALNSTHKIQNIGFGLFERPDDSPTQILLFEHVGSGSSVQVEFTPILAGYISSVRDFQEGQVLRGRLSSPILFKQNLVELEEETYWKLEYDHATDEYKITRES